MNNLNDFVRIKLITKKYQIVYQDVDDNKYYRGSLINTDNGNLVIKLSLNNDINSKKIGSFTEEKEKYDNQRYYAVNSFVNRCDNIMVLAGAGSSISSNSDKLKIANRKYPGKFLNGLTMEGLAKYINESLEKSTVYFDLLKMSIMSGFCSSNLTKSKKESKIFNNFEDFLSNITGFSKYIKIIYKDNKHKINTYNNTIDEIHDLICKYCSLKFHSSYFDHLKLINKLRLLNNSDERLKIYSTNYDTLFEQAASLAHLFVIDGFDYCPTRMFKSDALNIDFVNRRNDSQEMNTSNTSLYPNVIKIYQLHGSVTWYRHKGNVFKTKPNIVRRHVQKNNDEYCMIFPGKHKYEQSYTDPYFDMFFQFQKDLHKKNTLLIVLGFSFGDMHIRRMVNDAIKSNENLNMIFVSYKGLGAKIIKYNKKKHEIELHINNNDIYDFCDMSLVNHELFTTGTLGQFTRDLNLNDIYNN